MLVIVLDRVDWAGVVMAAGVLASGLWITANARRVAEHHARLRGDDDPWFGESLRGTGARWSTRALGLFFVCAAVVMGLRALLRLA